MKDSLRYGEGVIAADEYQIPLGEWLFPLGENDYQLDECLSTPGEW